MTNTSDNQTTSPARAFAGTGRCGEGLETPAPLGGTEAVPVTSGDRHGVDETPLLVKVLFGVGLAAWLGFTFAVQVGWVF